MEADIITLRPGNRTSRALTTTAAMGAASVVRLAAAAASVPFAITYLGEGLFGLVATITGVVAWFTVIDGGIALSLKNQLLRLYATEFSRTSIDRFVSTCFFTLLAVAGACLAVIAVAAHLLPLSWLFNLGSGIPESTARALLIAVAAVILLSIPMSVPRIVMASNQREYLTAPWIMIGAVAGVAMIWVAVTLDLGTVPVAIATSLGVLLGSAATAVHMHRRFARLRLSSFGGAELATILGPGMYFFSIQVATIFIYKIDIFIANFFLGNAAAAEFFLHQQLFWYIQAGLSLLFSPFASAIGDAWHRTERHWARRTVLSLTAISTILALVFIGGLLAFGPQIFGLWTRDTVTWNKHLAEVLAIYGVILAVTSVPAMALNTLGIVRDPARVIAVQAVLNPVLAVAFVGSMGLTGIALAALVSYMATSFWYVPYKLIKSAGGMR